MVLEIMAATAGSLFSLFILLKCCVCIREEKASKILKEQNNFNLKPVPKSKSLKLAKPVCVPETIAELSEKELTPTSKSSSHSLSSSSSWKSSLSNIGDFIEDYMEPAFVSTTDTNPSSPEALLNHLSPEPDLLDSDASSEETTFVMVDELDYEQELGTNMETTRF